MAIKVTPAFTRYVELMAERARQRGAGSLSAEKERRFEDALTKCEAGMTENERKAIQIMAAGAERMPAPPPGEGNFAIDTSKPPYQVQCPRCNAYALAPCRSQARPLIGHDLLGPKFGKWPSGARILREAHPERRVFWEKNPHLRSRAM